MHLATRLGALVLAVAVASPALADSTLRVFATQSVKGELRDCGCKGKPLGGLAARATMISEDSQGADAVLAVDAGNWSELGKENSLAKSRFIYEVMAELGYDAVTVGASELSFGREALDAMLAAEPGIEVVSANITDKSGNLVFPAYSLIEKNGLTIGVTGVTADAAYRFNLTRGAAESDDFSFREPRASLDEVLPALREKADLVVVLAHVGPSDAKRWAGELEGVDVLVAGQDPGYSFSPDRMGDTLLLRGGSQGKYLSTLQLVLDADGRPVDYNGEAKPVTKRVTEDPRIAGMVTAWEKAHGEYKPEIEAATDDPVAAGSK